MLPSLVTRANLPNAIALSSVQFNLAQMVGPLIGGGLLVAFGIVVCFGINSASFLAVIVVLSLMHLPAPQADSKQQLTTELKSGSFVRRQRPLLALTVLAMATTTLGVPVRAFLPVFANDAAHLSQMMAVLGAGAVVGALTVAWLGKFQQMGKTLLVVQLFFGGLVALFATLPITSASCLILFFIGATLLVVFSLTNSLVQLAVPDKLRGRVLSIYMVAFRGGMPLGSLVSGYLITLLSEQIVIAFNGVLLASVAIYFLIRSHGVREI